MQDELIERMMQIGTVTSVDGRRCRVKFPETGITSGWMPVIQNGTGWMPGINDSVLVLYRPVFNSDGIVMGGV